MPLTPLRRLLTLVLVVIGVCTVYGVVGAWTAGGPVHVLPTPIDERVRLEPAWVLVYAMVFFQAMAPISVVTDTRALDRTAAGYLTLYAIATPIWLAYPVTVPREPLPIVDVWTYGIAIVRYVDPPTNCLPSMHVALATFAALVVRRHDAVAGTVLLGVAALITWSTLATEQHWLLDGVAAITLALLADAAWFGWRKLPAEALVPLPRRWHAGWVLPWVAGTLVLMSGWWFGWMPVAALSEGAW